MAFVVTEQCIKCKYKDCMDPCPVECFHEGPDLLVIDPDLCIDCNVCATECPVDAIYQDKNVPVDQMIFIEINRILSKLYPNASKDGAPLCDRDEWAGITDKRRFIAVQCANRV